MFIARLGFYMSNKVTCVRRIEKSVYIIMALLEVSFVVASLCVFTELDAIKASGGIRLCACRDVSGLYRYLPVWLRLTKKSRCAGEGSGSYFGNPLYFVETLIPAAGLAVSCVTGDSDLRMTAILGLLIAAVPYLASVTIKRNSDCFRNSRGGACAVIMGLLVYITYPVSKIGC